MDIRLIIGAVAVAALAPSTYAGLSEGIIFDAETPYLSSADSPFDLNAPGFWLEDFEDGSFDLPGTMLSTGALRAPSNYTDSVDSDDGLLNGLGRSGWSWHDSHATTLRISFDAETLGGLPSHAGFVLTDTLVFDIVTFEVFGADGGSLGMLTTSFGDGLYTGETGEDRFFGGVWFEGISAIEIRVTDGIELDHVQFGGIVPVPTPGCLALLGLGALAGRRRRRD